MTIEIHAQRAYVDKTMSSLVIPLLEHEKRRFLKGGPLGYHQKWETVLHYCYTTDGRLGFSAGLVPRVQRQLQDQGIDVVIDDRTYWNHLSQTDDHVFNAPDLTEAEERMLVALSTNPFGQILLQKPSEIGRKIALLARLFPGYSFFVVAKNKKRVRQLVKSISEHTDQLVTGDSRQICTVGNHIYVGTLLMFHLSCTDFFHIAILTDTESALASWTMDTLVIWNDKTWYSFFDANQKPSEYEQFRLEELCGPVIHAPLPDHSPLKVNVMFVECHRDRISNIKRGLSHKRTLYWHSDTWNELVVKTATSFTRKSSHNAGTQSVCILVESSEHGEELLRLLPDWELKTTDRLTSMVPHVAGNQIATFGYAKMWGIGVDVLIRADGGSGWPLPLPIRQSQGAGDSLLVVDFADEASQTAMQDTHSRRNTYKQLRWETAPGNVLNCFHKKTQKNHKTGKLLMQ
jgi:hypothetical protein